MTRLFFNQTYLESRGRLYAISLRAGDGICDPSRQGGSCFGRVIALFKNQKTPH